jgi:hypothetical protein
MKREDRGEKTRDEGRKEERQPQERKVAPPIEREHETRQGVEQEDEKHKRDRERR